MEPYIPKKSKLRGPNRPKIIHKDGNHKIRKKIKDGVLATKRALKKAVRRENKIDVRDFN